MFHALFAIVSVVQAGAAPSNDVSAQFQIDPSLEVALWAESPQLFNPTAIDVDARGRVWVAEGVDYRQWNGRNPGLHRDEGDRIVILEDSDGDGRCDKAKTFVQEKELVSPLGICVVGKQVIVSCSPNAIVYTDNDGDDVPDKREVFLTGFGGHDHDHGLHSFVAGPDGQWYFNVGNAGPHVVADKLGWTLRSGSLYADGGEHTADNRPGLRSDDGRIWTGGLILRIGSNGQGLSVLAHNFRNNYEVALDSFGNLWQTDNDDDGNAACRTLFCLRGGNHGYFSADGSRYWNADRRPGQSTQTAHWHQEDPGVVPAGCINGGGGPTGLCVYEGDLMPSLRGAILDCDAGAGVVYLHRPSAQGAGYTLEKSDLLSSRGGAGTEKQRTWFRPSDVCVATDGSLFVADWWDPGVGGHAAGDREAYGRILRIKPKASAPKLPHYDLRTIPGAIEALSSPAISARALGWRKLVEERALALPALRTLLASKDSRLHARALWVVSLLGDEGQKELDKALEDPDPDIRVTAWRALNARPPFFPRYAEQLSQTDPSPAVAREVALTLRDVDLQRAGKPWLALANRFDGSDRWMLEALGIGAQGREAELYDAYFSGPKTHALEWSPAQAAIAWRLHPKAAIPALAQRALSPTLTTEARRAAVDALAFCKEREAADAVVNVALAGPSDVQELAAWWVRMRDENEWSDYHLARELAPVTRDGAQLVWSSGILEQGSQACDVDVSGARSLWLVVTSGKRGNGHDWSDWLDAKLIGASGEVSLDSLTWARASAEWGETRVGKNAAGGALKLDGREYAHGIGTHAASEIVYRLPEKRFTRFQASCALDDGGAKQPNAHPDVEFQVWLDVPEDRTRWRELEKLVSDPAADDAQRAKAARELARDREGGLLLVRLADENKLGASARDAVAQTIYANPDYAVRALAARSFPRTRPDGRPQPSAKEVAALAGDARRGRGVFYGEQAGCSKCHTFQGRGGDIGPDLTNVISKYGREALIDSILNPSAAISFGYETWLFETKDERLVSGFLLADGDKVVIKDTSGRRVVLENSEIASREKQRLSAMPDDVGLGLEPQAIADLASLLLQPASGPYELGAPVKLFDGQSLAGWTFFLDDPKARMEDVWSVSEGILHCKGQPIGYLRTERDFTSFELSLDWRFPPGAQPGNSGVLLRVQAPDKVWPKSIEAQLQHRSAGDIWNIDEFPMDVERARTDGRHTVKLAPSNEKPIGEWNHYRIVLNKGELLLEVNGFVQNRARWCEVVPGKIALQSEGAPIEFRDIVLRPIE